MYYPFNKEKKVRDNLKTKVFFEACEPQVIFANTTFIIALIVYTNSILK